VSRQKQRALKAEKSGALNRQKMQKSRTRKKERSLEQTETTEIWNQTGTEKSGTRENREISATEIHRNLARRDSKGLHRVTLYQAPKGKQNDGSFTVSYNEMDLCSTFWI
jgi:hypothetical protein